MKKEILFGAGIVCVVVLIIVVTQIFLYGRPDPNTYQAVFLTNGQVYFGKLQNIKSKYPLMTDIYYLRANKNLQSGEGGEEGQPQLSLVKLGQEVHSPQDAMYLNQEQILFWENLRQDSRVVQLINQQKAQPAQGTQVPQDSPEANAQAPKTETPKPVKPAK